MPTKTTNANGDNNQTQNQAQNPAEEIAQTQGEPQKTTVLIKGSYGTEYFKRNDIPFCPLCGEQFHNNLDGTAVCPENFKPNVCPRLS